MPGLCGFSTPHHLCSFLLQPGSPNMGKERVEPECSSGGRSAHHRWVLQADEPVNQDKIAPKHVSLHSIWLCLSSRLHNNLKQKLQTLKTIYSLACCWLNTIVSHIIAQKKWRIHSCKKIWLNCEFGCETAAERCGSLKHCAFSLRSFIGSIIPRSKFVFSISCQYKSVL